MRYFTIALFCGIGFVEAYCYINGYFVCGVLLDMANDAFISWQIEQKRLN
jgi:hypothetical protein